MKCVLLLCMSETRAFIPKQQSSVYLMAGDQLLIEESLAEELIKQDKVFSVKMKDIDQKINLKSGKYEVIKAPYNPKPAAPAPEVKKPEEKKVEASK